MTERGGARARAWAPLARWTGGVAACTLLLWVLRDSLGAAHMVLAYLLVVLLGSARHGRVVGLVLSLASFLAFNFFLLPPFYTLALHDPRDLLVLVAFLVTGAVAAQLFHRAQRAVAIAESRARELERLSTIGAEGLAAPRAEEGVRSLTKVMADELGVPACDVVMLDADGRPEAADAAAHPEDAAVLALALREGRATGLRYGSAVPHILPAGPLGPTVGALPELSLLAVPLRVRDAIVGLLVLRDPEGLALGAERAHFVDALTYYAALAVERVRLSRDAEHVSALREADRAKDAVLASVSHDLRTPLTSIRALAAELRAAGDMRAAIIEEEAMRLGRMVTDLLDLSRIRMRSLPMDLQLIAAEDVVGVALERLSGAGGERVEVRLPADGSLPVGRIDFTHTLRAVVNLLENALRHSPTVELEVRQEGEWLSLRVLDRGPGVPESERARVFDSFQTSDQAPATTRRKGLGLAIARSLAEVQGGRLEYAPREGGGSVFELRLPADSQGAPAHIFTIP